MNFLGPIVEAPFGFSPGPGAPSLALLPSQWAYRTGQPLRVELVGTPDAAPRDLYVAVQLPDGSLLFLTGAGGFSPTLPPWRANWVGTPLSQPVIDYPFTGGEPVGAYRILAGLALPGTQTFVGPILSAPFSFAP